MKNNEKHLENNEKTMNIMKNHVKMNNNEKHLQNNEKSLQIYNENIFKIMKN